MAVLFTLAGVAVGIVVARSRRRSNTSPGGRGSPSSSSGRASPGHAVSFGYKSSWLAVDSDDPRAVLSALGARNVRGAGWPQGVGAGDGRIFATPPIDGWVLVVGDLPDLGGGAGLSLVSGLSGKLGTEVQYFGTHRVVEYQAWARARNGMIVRAYGYLGERGQTLLDEGGQSDEEIALGLSFFDERSPEAEHDDYWERDDLYFPRENDVMNIAAEWSIDPTTLADRGPVGTGWLARWQPSWFTPD